MPVRKGEQVSRWRHIGPDATLAALQDRGGRPDLVDLASRCPIGAPGRWAHAQARCSLLLAARDDATESAVLAVNDVQESIVAGLVDGRYDPTSTQTFASYHLAEQARQEWLTEARLLQEAADRLAVIPEPTADDFADPAVREWLEDQAGLGDIDAVLLLWPDVDHSDATDLPELTGNVPADCVACWSYLAADSARWVLVDLSEPHQQFLALVAPIEPNRQRVGVAP